MSFRKLLTIAVVVLTVAGLTLAGSGIALQNNGDRSGASITFDRLETTTGEHSMNAYAPGQPAEAVATVEVPGSETYTIRVVDDDQPGPAVDGDILASKTVDAAGKDEMQVDVRVPYEKIRHARNNDGGGLLTDRAIEFHVQILHNGTVIDTSDRIKIGQHATTLYLNDTPEQIEEGESMNLSFYGWTSEPNHLHYKIYAKLHLGSPDVVAVGEVMVNDGHFTATIETGNITTATVKDRIDIWVKADGYKSDEHSVRVAD